MSTALHKNKNTLAIAIQPQLIYVTCFANYSVDNNIIAIQPQLVYVTCFANYSVDNNYSYLKIQLPTILLQLKQEGRGHCTLGQNVPSHLAWGTFYPEGGHSTLAQNVRGDILHQGRMSGGTFYTRVECPGDIPHQGRMSGGTFCWGDIIPYDTVWLARTIVQHINFYFHVFASS